MDKTISIEGLTELQEDFQNLVKAYPDKAGDLLRKNARELRKEVVRETRKLTKTDSSSKVSLGKLGSYKISQVQGYGADQYVEVSAKSPHFHLVEHGHVLKTKDGRSIGFVQGKHMMDNAVKKQQEDMPRAVSKMLDEMLREAGFE